MLAPPPYSPAPRCPRPGICLCWILALSALSIVGHGHNFGVGNHTIYLTWIERLRDPAFAPGDWYLSTPMMHENVVRPLRRLGDWMGDANAFLLALFFTRVMLVWGVWRLARVLGGWGLEGAIAAALVILAPRVSLGGHYASGAYFEASHLGMAFAVIAMSFLVDRRYALAGLFIGAAGHAHIFAGAHAGAIALLAVWLDPSWDRRAPARQSLPLLSHALRCRLRNSLLLALPALLVAGYTIAKTLSGYFAAAGPSPLSTPDVVEILCFRHPHHHSPLSWPLVPSLLFLAYVALGVVLAIRRGGASGRGGPVFLALFLYCAAGAVIGTVFVEWIPVGLAALLQFFRPTVLLMVWTAAEFALFLAALLKEELSAWADS